MLLKLATFVYGISLVSMIGLADTGRLPEWARSLYRLPFGDDLAHGFVACSLTLLLTALLAPRRVRLVGVQVRLGPVLAFGLLAAEELSQVFFASRRASPIDFFSTTLGVLLGMAVTHLVQARRRRQVSEPRSAVLHPTLGQD